MRPRLPRPSYANVVSTLALFVALGGSAVAAGLIDGSDIRRGTITGRQVKAKSVPGGDLKPNTVAGRQVKESTLGEVPRAQTARTAQTAQSAASAERAAQAQAAAHATSADSAATAATAATASVAQLLGGRSAEELTDSCPAGTVEYGGVCFEATSRGPDDWPAAARECGDDGGRLPGLDQLEGFRQLPGVTLTGTEHTTAYLDLNGLASSGEATVGISDNGTLSPGYDYGFSNASYRCVFPKTNAG